MNPVSVICTAALWIYWLTTNAAVLNWMSSAKKESEQWRLNDKILAEGRKIPSAIFTSALEKFAKLVYNVVCIIVYNTR
jgi:hypothetical protein